MGTYHVMLNTPTTSRRTSTLPSRRRRLKRSNRSRKVARFSKSRNPWKNPIPLSGMFKFTYYDSGFELHPAAALYQQSAVFSGNSPYDPDVSGAGVQPYGFDNYFGANAPFQRYQVYASKITISPAIMGTDTEAEMRNIRLALVPTPETALSYIEYNDLMTTPGAKGLIIKSQDSVKPFSAYWTTKRAWPVDVPDYDTSGTFGANPDRRWYWHLFIDTSNVSADIIMKYDVKITYYVKGMRQIAMNES